MEISRLVAPVLSVVVKAAVERPVGAGLVESPLHPEGRFKIPGSRIKNFTEDLSRNLVKQVSDSLGTLRTVEFASLTAADWNAVVEAAFESLSSILPITTARFLEMDLEPEKLATAAMKANARRIDARGLSDSQTAAYRRVLTDAAWQIVEFCTRTPEFSKMVQVELLRRTGQIRGERVRTGGTQQNENAEFERRYCEIVAAKLDALQLFGVTLRHTDKYSLSAAYLALHAAPEDGLARLAAPNAQRLRIDEALAGADRVLIRGDARSGKTTLLQWLAVNAVRAPHNLPTGWHESVPFMLPLRRFPSGKLPGPKQFAEQVAPALSAEAPPGWVTDVLNSGRALLLIDGVDEVPAEQRAAVWEWLRDLTSTYPAAKYVVSSRPPAAVARKLVPLSFKTFMLLPLGTGEIRSFVSHWHEAMAAANPESRTTVTHFERDLLDKLSKRRDLRRLATNPLLCALICALHLDRYRQLPQDRIGLYRAALEMLLVRRDEARGVQATGPRITQQEQEALLGQLAYWLVRNGRVDTSKSEATQRLAKYSESLPHLRAEPSVIMDHLLLRSGVLREPVADRVDFLHKTFQEYLAALSVLDNGDIDSMLAHAHEDQWREVVVMAVGHGRRDERTRIIKGLVDRGDAESQHRLRLHLLAASCLDHPGALDPQLAAAVKRRAAQLIVPRSYDDVDLIAAAGDVVLDLIPDPANLSDADGQFLVDLLGRFDAEDTLPVLARMAKAPSRLVRQKLAMTWPRVEPDLYVRNVLSEMRLDDVTLHVRGDGQLQTINQLQDLNALLAQDVSTLSPVAGHGGIRTLMLDSSRPGGMRPVRRLASLRSLILSGPDCISGVQAYTGADIEELAILNLPGSDVGHDLSSMISTLMRLRRLTVDGSYPWPSRPVFAEAAAPERLDLLATGWMAGLVDHPSRSSAWSAIAGKHLGAAWSRPTAEMAKGVRSIREVSLSGWPSDVDLGVLQDLPNLQTLRLIVIKDDELRARALANGIHYPHPDIASGMRSTARTLPNLQTIEIFVLGLVVLPDGDRTVESLPARDETVRPLIADALPAESEIHIVLNGIIVTHPSKRSSAAKHSRS